MYREINILSGDNQPRVRGNDRKDKSTFSILVFTTNLYS